jgi:uncharacterized membrane protein
MIEPDKGYQDNVEASDKGSYNENQEPWDYQSSVEPSRSTERIYTPYHSGAENSWHDYSHEQKNSTYNKPLKAHKKRHSEWVDHRDYNRWYSGSDEYKYQAYQPDGSNMRYRDNRNIYALPPEPTRRPVDEKRRSLLEHFGIFPSVPTINLLKICAIITLIAVVELNILMNLNAEKIIGDFIPIKANILVFVGLIGVFLAILYRYTEFEYEQQQIQQERYGRSDFKTSLKLFFLVILFIFIVIEVIFELVSARGVLFVVDLLSILIMCFGTYTILSGKRYFNITTFIFLFLLMLIGIDYHPDLPMMIFLGILTIIYIELSDGVCRLQEHIKKFQDLADSAEDTTAQNRIELDLHLDNMVIKYVQNLGLFIVLTLIISGILLGMFLTYPYFTPPYMNENLEMHSIYALLPMFVLLFLIFLIIYLFSSQNRDSEQQSVNKQYQLNVPEKP